MASKPRDIFLRLTASRGGRTIFYSRADASVHELMLVENLPVSTPPGQSMVRTAAHRAGHEIEPGPEVRASSGICAEIGDTPDLT